MRSTYCPVMVGREAERSTIEQRLAEAADGSGGVVVITGEAGIGKTRLGEEARAVAGARGIRTATGRAVIDGGSLPFRPLAEVLLHAFRATGLPDDRSLDAFRAHLGRLVPEWSGDATAEPSPLLIGEAIVRLLRAADQGTGWLLVLEDLQWADADTLTVIEFLADTLRTENVLCVLTMRAEGTTAADLLSRLRARRVETIELRRLSADEVGLMTAACLGTGTGTLPDPLDDFIRLQAEGAPLVVEEVLAGLVSAGQLTMDGDGWQVNGALEPRATSSIAESVEQRLRSMPVEARSTLAAAAVIGRQFDWQLLGAISGLDEPTVNDALRACVAQQLIVVDDGEFAFRHALIRQSVLERLLPPERIGLARRALVAVDAAHPDLDGDWCELAASLAIDAGDRTRAAELLAESARRAAARGAFSSAQRALERARSMAPEQIRPWVERQLMGVWLHVGQPAMVLELGERHLAAGGDRALTPVDHLLVLVDMAAAALAVGEVDRSARLAADALEVGRTSAAGDAAIGRAEVTAARAAVAGGRTAEATRLAVSAIDRAVSTGRADLESEGLRLLAAAVDELDERTALLERAITVAKQAGLLSLALEAQFQLASVEGTVDDGAQLRAVREEAARTGAVVTAASCDLIVADLAFVALDHDTCLDAAQRCVEASRRFGLAMLPVAQLWLAGAHAIGGRGDEMEAVLAEAGELSGGDPRVEADAWGRVRATAAFLRSDRVAFVDALDRGVVLARTAPQTSSVFVGRLHWMLLRATHADDLGAAARAEVAAAAYLPMFFAMIGWADAITCGRRGEAAAAGAMFDEHDATITPPLRNWGAVNIAKVLVAEAALRDGWGEPVPWLRELEAWFFERRLERAARHCRTLLGTAGEPVPRRRRGQPAVAPRLRALGITGREVEVLLLVAQGRSNRDIADQLFLSVRTVEHHVASLFTRTGVRDRSALASFASAD